MMEEEEHSMQTMQQSIQCRKCRCRQSRLVSDTDNRNLYNNSKQRNNRWIHTDRSKCKDRGMGGTLNTVLKIGTKQATWNLNGGGITVKGLEMTESTKWDDNNRY